MNEDINIYQFWCSLDYLHKHTKEFHNGSIFITDITGNDCDHLRVTFIQKTISDPNKIYTLPKDWKKDKCYTFSVKEALQN